MSGPKPALGYPTRTAAVLALMAQGKKAPEIARMIGMSAKDVVSLKCSAQRGPRREGQEEAREKPGFHIPLDVRQQLAPHARKRDMTIERLILELAAVIGRDSLVDAILDDQTGAA